jgi:hypothetical protein
MALIFAIPPRQKNQVVCTMRGQLVRRCQMIESRGKKDSGEMAGCGTKFDQLQWIFVKKVVGRMSLPAFQ